VSGRGDLVADVASGRQKLDTVKDEDLPEPIRKMEPAARKVHVEAQSAKRRELNDALAALVEKRDAYVAEQRRKEPAKSGDSFDRAVEKTIQSQIKR
jgi:hypothetical protein